MPRRAACASRSHGSSYKRFCHLLPHAALALREMHDANLLTAISFPELTAIESLVIRDFYHQYTVDEHTLVAIGNVLALRDQQGSAFAELAREHSDVSLLIMALLVS